MNFVFILLTILILFISIINLCILFYIEKPEGNMGEIGLIGKKGLIGNQGITGPRGLPGRKGDTGNIGNSFGLNGLKGNNGLPGDKGPKGYDGFEGLRGLSGDKGSVGYQGLKGPPGKTGRIGKKGPSRIINNNNDIPLIGLKDKCITIKDNGANDINLFKCPNNMAIFDFTASKIDINSDNMKIESITCCRFGIESNILRTKYNLNEVVIYLAPIISNLLVTYNDMDELTMSDDEKKIKNNLKLINSFFLNQERIPQEFIYIIRLLFQLRNDTERLMEELKKFPKNNIIELENYLNIE